MILKSEFNPFQRSGFCHHSHLSSSIYKTHWKLSFDLLSPLKHKSLRRNTVSLYVYNVPGIKQSVLSVAQLPLTLSNAINDSA